MNESRKTLFCGYYAAKWWPTVVYYKALNATIIQLLGETVLIRSVKERNKGMNHSLKGLNKVT